MRERLIIVASVLVIVGLGGSLASSVLGGPSAKQQLMASSAKTEAQGTFTARLTATASVDGKQLMSMTGTTSADPARAVHATSLRMDMMSIITVQMNEVGTATSSAVQLPTLGTTWYDNDDEDESAAASGAATDTMNDQHEFMKDLAESASEVVAVGSEELGGRTVDHFRVTLDGAMLAAAADLGGVAASAAPPTEVTADVWCDAETQLPVREDVSFEMTAKGKVMKIDVSLADMQFGAPVNIQVPDPAIVRPASEMQQAIQNLAASAA